MKEINEKGILRLYFRGYTYSEIVKELDGVSSKDISDVVKGFMVSFNEETQNSINKIRDDSVVFMNENRMRRDSFYLKKSWTDALNSRLDKMMTQCYEAGLSIYDIRRVTGLSSNEVSDTIMLYLSETESYKIREKNLEKQGVSTNQNLKINSLLKNKINRNNMYINRKISKAELRHERIAELFYAGVSLDDIATEVGLKKGTVIQYINKNLLSSGVKGITLKREERKIRNEKIREYYEEGLSFEEIGRKVDLSGGTVGQIVNRNFIHTNSFSIRKENLRKAKMRKEISKSLNENIDCGLVDLEDVVIVSKQEGKKIRNEKIKKYYELGLSIDEICGIVDLSSHSVTQYIRKNFIQTDSYRIRKDNLEIRNQTIEALLSKDKILFNEDMKKEFPIYLDTEKLILECYKFGLSVNRTVEITQQTKESVINKFTLFSTDSELFELREVAIECCPIKEKFEILDKIKVQYEKGLTNNKISSMIGINANKVGVYVNHYLVDTESSIKREKILSVKREQKSKERKEQKAKEKKSKSK